MAGALGMHGQELLTKRKIFQDEIPTRTQGAHNPADEVPEPQEHGRTLIERSGNKTDPKPFILRVHDILMWDTEPYEILKQVWNAGLLSGYRTDTLSCVPVRLPYLSDSALKTSPIGPRRLLFVDDEESVRATLPLILQARGFEVKVAASVSEAIQKIQNHDFDVLLSDLNIAKPGDGFNVVSAIRRVNPHAVTVILTGYPAFETAVDGIQHQIDDYLVKPADIDLLVETMERKLAERQSRPCSCPAEHP
jgi:ActR/RegA family two-component response regulator